MASFTDNVPQFNPYIQQQPVEAMAAVGIQREQDFKIGIDKVQSYYDNLLSLPIAKTETQDYVKMKVGELNNSVGKSVSGDFSDQRLINQIGGLAKNIANDPIIQNGVRSTAAVQAGFAAIEQSKKDKNYAPQNEQYFTNLVNQWQHDGDIQSSFADQYTPHTDYMDRFQKALDKAHPGEGLNARDVYVTDESGNFVKDAQGKLQVSPTIRSGIDANKISAIWQTVASQPDVQQQLNIDGWSRYRGVSASALWQSQKASTNNFITNAEKAINDLQNKIATDKTVNVADATRSINAYKEQIQGQKDRFNGISELIQKNPAAAKSALVENETLSGLVGAYSYQEMKKSPLWETSMEGAKFDLDIIRNQLEQEKFKYQKLNDAANRGERLQEALIRATARGKKLDENGNPIAGSDGGDVDSEIMNVPEGAGGAGTATFDNNYKTTMDQLYQGTAGVVFDMYNNKEKNVASGFNPIKKDPTTGAFMFNVDPTGTSGFKDINAAHAAYTKAYMDGRTAVNIGTANTSTVKSYQSIDPILRYTKTLTQQKDELDVQRTAIMQQVAATTGVKNPAYVDAYISENRLAGWQNSEARLKQQYGADWKHGLGIQSVPKQNFQNAGSGLGVGTDQGKGLNSANLTEYQGFSKKFDKSVIPKFQELENNYKAKQEQYYPIQSAFTSGDPKDKENLRQAFANKSNAYTQGNDAYKDFRELLSDDKEKHKDNIYGGVYNPLDSKYFLTVQRDATSEPKRLEVSQATFESFPGLKTTNTFDKLFGPTLALSGGTTTDVPYKGNTDGIGSAFRMDRNYDSKYDVRYHVIQNSQGTWDLRLYIKDSKTGNDIVSGVPAGFSATKSGIISALDGLKNDTIIEGYIPPETLMKMKQPDAGQ